MLQRWAGVFPRAALGTRSALGACVAALLLAAVAPAQPPNPQQPNPQQPGGQQPGLPQGPGEEVRSPGDVLDRLRALSSLEGMEVTEIRIYRYVQGEEVQLDGRSAAGILRTIKTAVGSPLDLDTVERDVRALWRERSMAVGFYGKIEEGRLVLNLPIVRQWKTFDQLEFRGNRAFDAEKIRSEILGLPAGERVNGLQAKGLRNILINHYKREGYPFCSVQDEPRESLPEEGDLSTLVFRIDEGPKVTVRDVYVRGNESFDRTHAFAALVVEELLLPDASVESRPRLFGGEAFSMEKVRNDLTRIELFYRKRGFRDAKAFLSDLVYSPDQTEVEVHILVDEGPRYTIRNVTVEHVDTSGLKVSEGAALYPPETLQEELRIKPGDFFDAAKIERDVTRLENWYGKRGHPTGAWFPTQVGNVLEVRGPAEVILPDYQLDLIFEVVEGRPKRVRDVLIGGNTNTKDRVVRRDVLQKPGQQVNTEELDRTLAVLRQRRYFRDPNTLQSAELELLSVQGDPDAVDVRVQVPDPPTTEFSWGVALGTGSGVSGRISLVKRNADLTRTPSDWSVSTFVEEFLENRAFHGGGQEVSIFLQPGTQRSLFQLSIFEPDVFRRHEDPFGLRVVGARRVDFEETYTTDVLLAELGLVKQLGYQSSAQLLFRQSTTEIENINPAAPGIVFASEGNNNEIREVEASFLYRDENRFIFPTEGYFARLSGTLAGGIFGANHDFVQLRAQGRALFPVYENDQGLEHVIQVSASMDWAEAYGRSEAVFVGRRYFMGGRNLRGFDVRRAGPTEFGNPVGGEAMLLASVEYQVPFIQRRGAGRTDVREAMRLVGFVDFGQLGTSLTDRTFDEFRMSAGFGVRIFIEELGIPIRIELGWPLFFEETDDRRQLFFTLSR